MSLRIGGFTLKSPVILAPMAGITDLPFRNLVSGFGTGLVVSEMVASQEMVQSRKSSQAKTRAELGLDRDSSAVQIAGRRADWMAECARICEGSGARMIDINMGCPAKKVTSGYSGSALMKDLNHALELIEAVVGAVSVPVTLKTRLGWDENTLNAVELARRAEDAGIQMLTIHGRTRCQFYKGQADWSRIGEVVDAVEIPVIANGDIVDIASARQALLQSGAAGIMVGRGARGRPWLLAELAAELFGFDGPTEPSGKELADLITAHYCGMLDFYGANLGLRVARKHLGWYMNFKLVPSDIRQQILTKTSPEKVLELIDQTFSTTPQMAAA
ncbi:MAG: tRNA dihydrouridine synthase DusB [Alphaproteobacteria bacterium]|nr:tRNA dihydrouridine synthase DusB [Alphaproteobacteria bacterium]